MLAQMNVRADVLATQEQVQNIKIEIFEKIPNKSTMDIQIKMNKQLCKRLRPQEIYTQITEKIGNKYWNKRLNWTKEISSTVWWEEIQIASSGLEKTKWMNMLKIFTGHIPVAHKLKQRNQQQINKCSCCGKSETVNHMFRSKSPIATTSWTNLIKKLEKYMIILNTKPTIKIYMLQYMKRWREYDNKEDITPEITPIIWKIKEHEAQNEQNKIGGRQLLCRKMAKSWGILQG